MSNLGGFVSNNKNEKFNSVKSNKAEIDDLKPTNAFGSSLIKPKNIISIVTAGGATALGASDVSNLAGGLILTTGAATQTVTLPTAVQLYDGLSAAPGDSFDFLVVNQSTGTVTVAVNTGITNPATADLTVPTVNAIAYRIIFISSTAAVISALAVGSA